MVWKEEAIERPGGGKRIILLAVGLVSLLLIAGLLYLRSRPGAPRGGGAAQQPRLENATRAGAPDFEKYQKLIVMDEPDALESGTALGGKRMDLRTTVRNFTGRTLGGLEVHGVMVDLDGKTVKERTVIVVPNRQPELENNKTIDVNVALENFTEEQWQARANYRMEVTGFSFK